MLKNERKLKKIEETREMVISFICRRRTQPKAEPSYLCFPSKRITRAFLVLSFSIYLVTSFLSDRKRNRTDKGTRSVLDCRSKEKFNTLCENTFSSISPSFPKKSLDLYRSDGKRFLSCCLNRMRRLLLLVPA